MHKIFGDIGMVSMLTSEIDAREHKHWMLQMFYSPNEKMYLSVEGKPIKGKLIVVNKNCMHSFCTNNEIHFSMLIIPGTDLCEHLIHAFLGDKKYYDFSSVVDEHFAQSFEQLIMNTTSDEYQQFKKSIYDVFAMKECTLSHENESRVSQIMGYFNKGNLSVTQLADELALSPSRLAHLFKENTGTPLKSFLVLNQMFLAFDDLFKGMSITDAAMNAGFDSPSHFAATTKKMMGESASKSLKDSEFLKVF